MRRRSLGVAAINARSTRRYLSFGNKAEGKVNARLGAHIV
jgi:hypothetical protein